MGPFGISELIFLFFLALVIFGPKKLPEIGKTLGKGMREFKKATDDLKSNWEEHIRESENDTSLKELKQTLQDVHSDVQASTHELGRQIQGHIDEVKNDVEAEATEAIPHEEKPAVSTQNKESDAHAN
jgi:sec-independent protein translocase protein TatA